MSQKGAPKITLEDGIIIISRCLEVLSNGVSISSIGTLMVLPDELIIDSGACDS
jgi:hypothetical protein